MTELLRLSGISRCFGGVHALSEVNLTFAEGEMVGVVGANGSGKTTLINLITGFDQPDSGTISLRGTSLVGCSPEAIARLGLARTFQQPRMFGGLPVIDHVILSLGVAQLQVARRAVFKPRTALRSQAEGILASLGLEEVASRNASDLPHGLQRRVEIARCLGLRPALVLLDEPAAGLTAQEAAELQGALSQIHAQQGVAMIVVDHRMSFVTSVCARMVVLEQGRVTSDRKQKDVPSPPDPGGHPC